MCVRECVYRGQRERREIGGRKETSLKGGGEKGGSMRMSMVRIHDTVEGNHL